jgi:lipopolysaccharide biosynthesis regulator YciM
VQVAAKASAPSKQEQDDDGAAACRRKVDDLERQARDGKDLEPTPQEELAIGQCYQALGNVAEARKWLERAASHRRTKPAAEEALRELGSE